MARVWSRRLVAIIVGLSGVGLSAARPCQGQAADMALLAELKKQPLYLRGFSADPIVTWRWDGKRLLSAEPKAQTLGEFVPDSVTVSKDRVVIEGTNHTLIGDGGTELMESTVDLKQSLVVDAHGGKAADTLPLLQQQLFYPDQPSALADVPKPFRSMVPADTSGKTRRQRSMAACDCAELPSAACPTEESPQLGMAGLSRPRVLNRVIAEYSEEARRKRTQGRVRLTFVVDDRGVPTHIWIAEPLPYGLNEKAVEALRQFRFEPITCHDKAVAVPMTMETTFATR